MGSIFRPGEPARSYSPNAVETYGLLVGEMEYYVGGKWTKVKKGDKLRIEKGQLHTFCNNSGSSANVYNSHQPAMDFEGFFRGVHKK